jgi:hypothetical protein
MTLPTEAQEAFAALEESVSERGCGVTHSALLPFGPVAPPPKAEDLALAVPLLQAHGLSGASPQALKAIDRDRARLILKRLLWRDQAYGSEVQDESMAQDQAQAFLALFGPEAAFFTNGSHHADGTLSGWSPCTQATFDTGVVAVGWDRLGLLWCEDED